MKFAIFLCISCFSVTAVKSLGIFGAFRGSNQRKSLPLLLKFPDDVNIMDKEFIENFASLPVELKIIILEYLTPKELLIFNQYESLKESHCLAVEAFGSVYRGAKISLVGLKVNESLDFIVSNDAKEISFTNVDTFITFAKVFEKYIKNLKIDFSTFECDDTTKIITNLRSNFAENLTRLEIRKSEFDIVREISFPNLEELSFFNCYFLDRPFDLHQFFPKVRRLSATLIESTEPDWIERNFSNLTHLQLELDDYLQFAEEDVLGILRKNPNINSLSVVGCTPNLLREINEHFPNIVNLGIIGLSKDFKLNTEVIRMKHIERFYYEQISAFGISAFIQFDHLNELQVNSKSKPEFILLDLIKNHKDQIEILEIEDIVMLDEHLVQMNLAKLERVTFRFDLRKSTTMTANGLLAFIRCNEQLAEVKLLGAKQQLQQELKEIVESSRISEGEEQIEIRNSNNEETGDVNIFRKSRPKVKLQKENVLQFLKSNF